MSFADWKKRSDLFIDAWAGNIHLRARIERACASAYKAGERQGRKDVKCIAQNAIALREKLK